MCTPFRSKLRASIPLPDLPVPHGRAVVLLNDAYLSGRPRSDASAGTAAREVTSSLHLAGFDVSHGPEDGVVNLTGVALDRCLTALAQESLSEHGGLVVVLSTRGLHTGNQTWLLGVDGGRVPLTPFLDRLATNPALKHKPVVVRCMLVVGWEWGGVRV